MAADIGWLAQMLCRRAAKGFARPPARFAARGGQTTVEYLLMLAAVASMMVVFTRYFGKYILGGFFTIVGMVIGK